MSVKLFRLFSRPEPPAPTAPVARERLQILLSKLREEILAAVSRHVALDPDKVIVRMERGKDVSTLEVDIELPNGLELPLAAAG